jgi:hypothetical protein
VFLVELQGSKSGQLFGLQRSLTDADLSPTTRLTKDECVTRLRTILNSFTHAEIVKFSFPFSDSIGPNVQSKVRPVISLFNPASMDSALMICMKVTSAPLRGSWILDIPADDMSPNNSVHQKADVCDVVTAPETNSDGTRNWSEYFVTRRIPLQLHDPIGTCARIRDRLVAVCLENPLVYDDAWLRVDSGMVVLQRAVREDGEVCVQRTIRQ